MTYGVMPGTWSCAAGGTDTGVGTVGTVTSARACATALARPPRSCPTAREAAAATATTPPPPSSSRRRSNAGRLLLGAAPSASRVVSAHRPASVPTSVGRTSSGRAPGRLSTAAAPSAPTTANATSPAVRRRAARTPTPAQTTARTNAIPTKSACLSLVPNVLTAKFFSHNGVRSTKAPPTASTGDGWPAER